MFSSEILLNGFLSPPILKHLFIGKRFKIFTKYIYADINGFTEHGKINSKNWHNLISC